MAGGISWTALTSSTSLSSVLPQTDDEKNNVSLNGCCIFLTRVGAAAVVDPGYFQEEAELLTVWMWVGVDGIIEENLQLLSPSSLAPQITELSLFVPAEPRELPGHGLPVDLLRVEDKYRPLLADQLASLDLPAGYEAFTSPLDILANTVRTCVDIPLPLLTFIT